MKSLKEYIVKESRSDSKFPDKDDWKVMKNLCDNEWNSDKVLDSIKNTNRLVKKYVAGLKLTSSELLEYDKEKKTFFSFPGNYFKEFGNRAVKEGIDPQYIINIFDETRIPTDYVEYSEKFSERLHKYVESLLESCLRTTNFSIVYTNNYTDTGKKLVLERNKFIAVPFILEVDDRGLNCEVIMDAAAHYYNYSVEGNDYKLSSQFAERLQELLK